MPRPRLANQLVKSLFAITKPQSDWLREQAFLRDKKSRDSGGYAVNASILVRNAIAFYQANTEIVDAYVAQHRDHNKRVDQ